MDLTRYCAKKYPAWNRTAYWGGGNYTTYFGLAGYPVLVANNARGWRCEVPTSEVNSGVTIPRWNFNRYSIDVNDVCRRQYGKGYAVLEVNNARGWACYVWVGAGF